MTKKNIENLLNFLDEIDSKIFNKLKKLDEIDFKLIKKFSSNNNTINSEKISKDKLVELILNSQLKLEKKEVLDRFEKLDKLKIFK